MWWGNIVYGVISVFLQCMNNILGHHVFNNESKYSMGHSERYLREDGPFRGALPIPVSRKTVPALTMVVAFSVMGFPWAPNSGFVSKYVYFIQILFWIAGGRWYFWIINDCLFIPPFQFHLERVECKYLAERVPWNRSKPPFHWLYDYVMSWS